MAYEVLIQESWVLLVVNTAWSSLIYYLNDFTGIELLAIPMVPITIIGIAVSLYLGFKSTSAHNRWWEARKIWGEIIILSRAWGTSVFSLIPTAFNFDRYEPIFSFRLI